MRAAAAEALRGLNDEIRIILWSEGNAVELAALLGAAGSKNAASIDEAARLELFVAGTRNHLYRTTITALSRR